MSDNLCTKHEVAQRFDVYVDTAQKWMALLAKGGFPFTKVGQARAIHEKDLSVIDEFVRLRKNGIKTEEAAVLAVSHWKGRKSDGDHGPHHSGEDRGLHILLEMFQPDHLKCILLELAPQRDTSLEDMIASIDKRRLKEALLERLSDREVRDVCKRFVCCA
ncbi:hypothetical protein [Tumebacillus flagellatus]|nr:hypothetical protein [Tumebacillus flagellatus]